ncbi:aminotransferase class V-fold PLP-dependent enzyme [Cohnella fermenti]|uniref:cysteine desulfurase n=1 Tax=Cohnella fermenti TaxID=2565925 RepID=A0A4S4BIR6_9BACL|nr:aminotransferase class V-fold PLP-dependent enzyme [Cohnella fermenti]THF73504.1 aminotransferase class V-fold PLP-dependent enzyme [Cohnella fermenti]
MSESIIYLDNAATSWPKPPSVHEAMERCLREAAANPGRGSHRMAVQASRVLFEGRKQLAKLFRVANPNDIAFTLNTTHSLNIAIQGWLRPGDHVIATSLEHNSIRRPLEALKRKIGIEITYVEPDIVGAVRAASVEEAIRPNTTLIAVTHSSNLLGTITPIGEIGEVARRRGVKLLVDAAQSAGVLDIDVEAMGIDMLAFPGHKGLMGPQGTGGLYLHPELEVEPLMQGGTGSSSESPEQPHTRPDRYEAGTPNTVGIAGLTAGVRFILEQSTEKIHRRESELTRALLEGLGSVEGVVLLGPGVEVERTAIVSFLIEGADPALTAFDLDKQYGIAVRAGFHCTPLGHRTVGTTATGAVRVSPGYFTTESDIVSMIEATKELARAYGKSHR